MISGFLPIIGNEPRMMILGSMPSITSLEKQEYYGFKHNRFWKIISAYFQIKFNSYEEKTDCIKNNHIVLWDVIQTCEREGSLDSAITKEVVNDIEDMIKKYPGIQTIICNGKKSYSLYKKHFSHIEVEVISLPSTSNANRTIKEEQLFEKWHKTLAYGLKKTFR